MLVPAIRARMSKWVQVIAAWFATSIICALQLLREWNKPPSWLQDDEIAMKLCLWQTNKRLRT